MTFFPSSDKDALTVTFINEFLFDFYDCSSGFLKICDLISVSSRAPWKCVFVWFGEKKKKKPVLTVMLFAGSAKASSGRNGDKL